MQGAQDTLRNRDMRNACKILVRQLGCNAKLCDLLTVRELVFKINYTKLLVREFGLASTDKKQESRRFSVDMVIKFWPHKK
jgi:hypothetical protein